MDKRLVGINVVEVWKNRELFIDGGCEVQSNFIMICFREIRFSSLKVKLCRRGRSLEMSQQFSARIGVSAVVLSAMI